MQKENHLVLKSNAGSLNVSSVLTIKRIEKNRVVFILLKPAARLLTAQESWSQRVESDEENTADD